MFIPCQLQVKLTGTLDLLFVLGEHLPSDFSVLIFASTHLLARPVGPKASTWWTLLINLRSVKKTRFVFLKINSKKNKGMNMRSWWRNSNMNASSRTASTDLAR